MRIDATRETRYGWDGVSFHYNPWKHGYYPERGWMRADDFEKMVARFRKSEEVEVIWTEEVSR